VAQTRKVAENLVLSSFGGDDQEFVQRTGLTHLSAYPLFAEGHFLGVLANYTQGPADADPLRWWQVYGEMSAVATHEALSEAESRKTITQLSLLFEATRLLNSTLDLAELLELIL